MERQDIFEGGNREVFGKEGIYGGVVDGVDGDGLVVIDFGGKVGFCEVVVEGGEFGGFSQNVGDVVVIGGGWCGGERKEEEEEKSFFMDEGIFLYCLLEREREE